MGCVWPAVHQCWMGQELRCNRKLQSILSFRQVAKYPQELERYFFFAQTMEQESAALELHTTRRSREQTILSFRKLSPMAGIFVG